MPSLHPVTARGTCPCVGKHVPLPTVLHRHHIIPKYLGGSNDASNIVTICPSTHDNVHGLLRQYAKHGGRPPGRIRKHYSDFVQDLASAAWAGAAEGIDRRSSINNALGEDLLDLLDDVE